jgi:hypothetical protein
MGYEKAITPYTVKMGRGTSLADRQAAMRERAERLRLALQRKAALKGIKLSSVQPSPSKLDEQTD